MSVGTPGEAGRPARSSRPSGGLVAAAVITGILLGIGGFTLHYAEAFSYLGEKPETCANCHIMQPQYDSWQKSSHHGVATCVDCHLPHGIVGKYAAKSLNGYHHSKGFTLQDFSEPILIKPFNSGILAENCLRCHADLVQEMGSRTVGDSADIRCVHCHSSAGHGEAAGLGGPDRGESAERNSP